MSKGKNLDIGNLKRDAGLDSESLYPPGDGPAYPTDALVKLAENLAFTIDAGIIREPDKLTWSIPVKSNLTERRWIGTFTLRPVPFTGRVPGAIGRQPAHVDRPDE